MLDSQSKALQTQILT